MKVIKMPVSSVCIVKNKVFCIKKTVPKKLALVEINLKEQNEKIISSFDGYNNKLLYHFYGKTFVGIDNTLLMSTDLTSWETVLETQIPTNFLWHMTQSNTGLFYTQEYGDSPNSIYMSKNGRDWAPVVSVKAIDKTAKHFHHVAYDEYHNTLITTLGDCNLTRIAISYNLGKDWVPLYNGPWQVVPIVIAKNQIVFGMDSAISPGGVLVWNPQAKKMQVLHGKWLNYNFRFFQMCDLKLLSNGLWVAALGDPQAVLISLNLKSWYMLHLSGFNEQFNYSMKISEGDDFIVCSTGAELIFIEKDKLSKYLLSAQPVFKTCKAWYPRIIGLGFMLKRKKIYQPFAKLLKEASLQKHVPTDVRV